MSEANPTSAARQRDWPRMAAAAVLVAGCVISLTLNWPGQLSYNSVIQLHDGRTGHYNSWHPPVMAWMLGLANSLVPGPGLFIVFDTSLMFASLLSVLWIAGRVSWAMAGVAAICAALPQVVLYQGIVWKDVLFADAAIAGFVCLAVAGARWGQESLRWGLLCAAFVCLGLATLARQNGAIVLAAGALAAAWIARSNGWRWSLALACGSGALGGALCVIIAANAALADRTTGTPGPQGQIKLLQLYDLIGEVSVDPALSLDRLSHVNPRLENIIRSDGVRLYTASRNDTLATSPDLQIAFVNTSAAALASQWWDTLLNHPTDYLAVRARVFAWVFFTPDPVQCDAYYAGVNGPPNYLRDLGLKPQFRPQDRALSNYAALFTRTPVFSRAGYAILALALLTFLIWRRRPADIAIVFLLAGALVFVGSFFVISIACDYRYLLFLDLSAMVAFFYCAATERDGACLAR